MSVSRDIGLHNCSLDRSNSALSPVLYRDIVPSINVQHNKNNSFIYSFTDKLPHSSSILLLCEMLLLSQIVLDQDWYIMTML